MNDDGHEMSVTLREVELGDGRIVMIDAGPIEGGPWEAWLACVRTGSHAGTVPTSKAVKYAADLEGLRSWATGLSFEEIAALADAHCP